MPDASPSPHLPQALERHTQALLFADVVESVRLMELDEAGHVARWRAFMHVLRSEVLPHHGGRLLKSMGDGLIAAFPQARDAVRAAFALHEPLARINAGVDEPQRIALRAAAHLTDYMADENDVYGAGINLTARLTGFAGPHDLVATAAFKDRLTPGLDAEVEDLGDCYLKHLREPVRCFRLAPVGLAGTARPLAAVRVDYRPTIAVLPFVLSTSQAGEELLGEILADRLIASLAISPDLRVISRLSTQAAWAHAGAAGSQSLLQHLGASYLLHGRCHSRGASLSVYAELVDAATGHVFWADTQQGRSDELFDAQGALVPALIAQVSRALLSHELQRARAQSMPSLQSYTLLLSAIALMHRHQLSDFERAREMLEHLVERDRRSALPHAWLAKWHVLRVQQGWSPDVEREAQLARSHSARAIDNDPDNGLAWTIDGFILTNLMGRIDEADRSYLQALRANPNESLAWLLKGMKSAFVGDGAPAVEDMARAVALSPLDPLRYFYDSLSASGLIAAGRYDESIQAAQRSLRHNRLHTSTYRALAIAQSLSGRTSDAQATVRQLLELDPQFTVARFEQRFPGRAQAPEYARKLGAALRAAGAPAG